MPNRQKLFETCGSALMICVLAGLIAAAILPWYTIGSCKYAWFPPAKCDPGVVVAEQVGPKAKMIYDAAYSLTVIACVLLGVCCIIYGLYVFGTQSQRCVYLHLVVVLLTVAAVVTFAVGLPSARKDDRGLSAPPPFFDGSNSSPGIGWWIALVAACIEAVVFILYFFAFR